MCANCFISAIFLKIVKISLTNNQKSEILTQY